MKLRPEHAQQLRGFYEGHDTRSRLAAWIESRFVDDAKVLLRHLRTGELSDGVDPARLPSVLEADEILSAYPGTLDILLTGMADARSIADTTYTHLILGYGGWTDTRHQTLSVIGRILTAAGTIWRRRLVDGQQVSAQQLERHLAYIHDVWRPERISPARLHASPELARLASEHQADSYYIVGMIVTAEACGYYPQYGMIHAESLAESPRSHDVDRSNLARFMIAHGLWQKTPELQPRWDDAVVS